MLACVFYGVFGDLHRVFAALFGIYLDADLPSEHLQLVDGCRTVNVAGDQQHLPAFLALDERSQLARESGFTRTLKTRDQNHGGIALQPDVRRRAAHQQGQLVAYDLGHHLSGLHRLQYVLSQRLLLHFVGERLGYLVVDVGVDQRTANLLEGFGDVDLRDAALAFEDFERPFEFIR